MRKLYILLANESRLRSDLKDLARRTGATFWLVASPRTIGALPDRHATIFSRVLEQEHFTAPALIERLEQVVGETQFDRLMFLTNDETCDLVCTELQQYFGEHVWSTEQLQPFVDKIASKRELSGCGIRVPRHIQFDKQRCVLEQHAYITQIAQELGFPMISKPTNLYGSIEVRRLENILDLSAWAQWCTGPRDHLTYEIDEFVEGELFHCDSLIQNGRIVWSNACKNVNPCMQFASGRSIGAFNIPAEHADAVAVREFNRRVLEALNPPDGATHMECFKTIAGELVFLEISARPPGGDMVGIYRYCFGFDLDVAHFMLRAREPYRLALNDTPRYGAWIIHPKRQGRVKAVHLPRLHSEHQIELNIAAGEIIGTGSRHIVEEPAAEFRLYSSDYARIDVDSTTLKELRLCEMDG